MRFPAENTGPGMAFLKINLELVRRDGLIGE
jgi:hypothetical protein